MLGTHRLRLLVALADTGSIAGAAQATGGSAAAASQQLARLERESRAQLLERSARSVRLTAAGELLVGRARRILADLEAAEQDVAAAGSAGGGRLRVGSFATAAHRFVVPVLGTLRRRHPALRLSFAELEPEDALPAVRAGELDVAVTHRYHPLAAPETGGLRRVSLYTDPMLLAVPAGTADGPADLGGFRGVDWVATYPDRGFQAVTEMTARLAGFEPRIVGRAAGYPVLLDLVAAGLGVGLVPRSAATPRAGITLLEITAPAGLHRVVELATRAADGSPAIAEFRRELRSRVARARR
ncbi:LysR substrate-binding domain-containing protein [Actinoplanes sp. NPDC020271]|uniref:LysR substrate-binding domain-containing protein n=1 Tax=Actinoplanes sp. NPDC020271 TaxID=3363896 RepID=UPI003797E56F